MLFYRLEIVVLYSLAAMLSICFIRVAQNMLSATHLSSKDIAVIKLLLENCIKLLQDNHSQLQV